MKTLIIIAGLFSAQPAPLSLDTQWIDLQSVRDQVRTYVTEDVASMTLALQSSLSEGIRAGAKIYDSLSEPAALVASQEQSALNEAAQKPQVN